MTTGERLRELRKTKRKTLRDVNIDLGVSYSNLAAIERGEHGCNADTLNKLAAYYDVSIDYLLGKTNNPNATIIQVASMDGFVTNVEYELLDKIKGFTVDDMKKLDEYIEFLKSKNKGV